jgi:hypothetical protein
MCIRDSSDRVTGKGVLALRRGYDDCTPGLLAWCVAVLLLMVAGALHYLPKDLAMIAVTWPMLSVSVGIWFGHGVLSEP